MWPFDEVVDAINGLFEVIPGLINLILYPILRIQDLIYNLFMYEFGKLVLLYDNIMAIPGIFLGLFDTVFSAVLPAAYLALFGVLILIVAALRVYAFVKDIEILGFSL